MVVISVFMLDCLTLRGIYNMIIKNRVAKVRKVLQNGMSFANERVTCGTFARPLLSSTFSFLRVQNFIGLSKNSF